MIEPSKRRGFTKGDPRAIAAGKKGYQVLRLKGLDPYLVKQIEERGYRRGFADGFALASGAVVGSEGRSSRGHASRLRSAAP